MSVLASRPLQTSLVDPPPERPNEVRYLTKPWYLWLAAVILRVQAAPEILKVVSLTNQSASIGTTAIPIGSISAGLYRINWHARITTAASVSSSLTVTIGYTDNAISCTQSGAALTGNTTATVQGGMAILRSDGAAPLTYSTTYASVGGTVMIYKLDVVAERLL